MGNQQTLGLRKTSGSSVSHADTPTKPVYFAGLIFRTRSAMICSHRTWRANLISLLKPKALFIAEQRQSQNGRRRSFRAHGSRLGTNRVWPTHGVPMCGHLAAPYHVHLTFKPPYTTIRNQGAHRAPETVWSSHSDVQWRHKQRVASGCSCSKGKSRARRVFGI